MKIVIPVDDNNTETNVCISFGRAPYFLLFDTETKESLFIDNSAIASTGGAGIKAAQTIIDHNAHILLTPRCGENAANMLKVADIKLYKTETTLANENIEAFIAGKLSLLTEIHSGFHGHGEN